MSDMSDPRSPRIDAGPAEPGLPTGRTHPTRVGAVDCGTNSLRLLVADLRGGRLTEIVRRMEIVRLGQGVDRSGVIAPESMARTLAVTAEYARQCDELGVEAVRFVATSATRDARNAAEFVEGVRAAFGERRVAPEVVSGQEEASLSFRGATGDVRAAALPGPYLVVDIGGGSTEFVRGTDDVETSLSVDVGCVRMTERHLDADPPRAADIAAATADIDAAIAGAEAAVGFAGCTTLVGLAGSVTTITAHALGLTSYERDRIHLADLPPEAILTACDDLLHRTREQRAALRFMHPGRVDVIGAGALVWSRVVRRFVDVAGEQDAAGSRSGRTPAARSLHVVTSEHDILDGIALGLGGTG